MFREGYFRPHVTAAEQRGRADIAARKLAKQGQILLPIHLEGRDIARTFWGKSWCKNLESYSDYENRLPRGRSYVRNGCVLDLQLSQGVVKALVKGTRLYRVHVTIAPIEAAAWKALKGECSRKVGSLMDLLQGKLSASVMEAITRRETGLFPKPSEIQFECSCPDWAGMCKHVAAALYGVGARLDHSPELLFVLRRADHLELITDATESVMAGVTMGEPATLASGDLAQVFGIEMESFAPAPSAPVRVEKRSPPRKVPAVAKAHQARAKQKAAAPKSGRRPPTIVVEKGGRSKPGPEERRGKA
jgi:uncharacterized Zn finger protein